MSRRADAAWALEPARPAIERELQRMRERRAALERPGALAERLRWRSPRPPGPLGEGRRWR